MKSLRYLANPGLLLLAYIAISSIVARSASEQRSVMHFSHNCLLVTKDTYADTPLIDGVPDYPHTRVEHLKVDERCGVIMVKR